MTSVEEEKAFQDYLLKFDVQFGEEASNILTVRSYALPFPTFQLSLVFMYGRAAFITSFEEGKRAPSIFGRLKI